MTTLNTGYTVVGATVRPLHVEDTFPVAEESLMFGSYRSVATTVARDAIPATYRNEGMLVFVRANTTRYRLMADLVTWAVDSSGGSAGTSNVIFATDFGVAADGTFTANGTDNTLALKSLCEYMALHDGLTVVFPQDQTKVVGYSGQINFRFINRIRFHFGSPLRNQGTPGIIFFGCDPYVNQIAGNFVTENLLRQLPFPIATVLHGSYTVTLATPARAANFTVGGWAMVCGYDHQGGGYPPNYRVFERLKVLSANASTGVITFDRGLKYDYYSTWFYYDDGGTWITGGGFTNRVGPAGIIPLDRGVYAKYCDTYTVENFTILKSLTDTVPDNTYDGEPTYGTSSVFFFGGHDVQVVNPRADQIYTGNSQRIEITNPACVFFNPDKTNDTLVVHGGRMTYFVEGTGFNHIAFNETVFRWRAAAGCRNVAYRKCRFTSLTESSPLSIASFVFQESLTVEDCLFDTPVDLSLFTGWDPNVSRGPASYEPGGFVVTVAATLGTGVFTADFGDGTFRIAAGFGIVLIRPSDNARFLINNITYDAGTNRLIVAYTGEGDMQVSVADVLYYRNTIMARLSGVQRTNAHPRRPLLIDKRPAEKFINLDDGIEDKDIDIVIRDVRRGGGINNAYEIDGVIYQIELIVTRAYSGVGDGRVQVSCYQPSGSTFPAQILLNTAIVGRRVALPSGSLNNNCVAASVVPFTATLSPALVAANTTAEQTFTVTGLATTDTILSVTKPTSQAGLFIDGSRISATNTLALTFGNNTAVGITPTATEAYKVDVYRPQAAAAASDLIADLGVGSYVGLLNVRVLATDNDADYSIRVQATRR